MPEKNRTPPFPETDPPAGPVEGQAWKGLEDVEFESVYQNGEIRPKPPGDKAGPEGSDDSGEADEKGATPPETRK